MRLAASISAAVLAFASAAAAQAPAVSVAIGPKLQAKAELYGQRELDFLAQDLRASVESRIARSNAFAPGGQLELVIVDARPNRPTYHQLGKRPDLTMLSFGNGGASVEGVYVAPDGSRIPVSYKWYGSNIAWAQSNTTWTDALETFDRMGERLAKSGAYAVR